MIGRKKSYLRKYDWNFSIYNNQRVRVSNTILKKKKTNKSKSFLPRQVSKLGIITQEGQNCTQSGQANLRLLLLPPAWEVFSVSWSKDKIESQQLAPVALRCHRIPVCHPPLNLPGMQCVVPGSSPGGSRVIRRGDGIRVLGKSYLIRNIKRD